RSGMLMGTYEKHGVPWSEIEAGWDFTFELLPPDLNRISDNLERGFEHFPPFADAGIKNVINGPFTFAPDGNPVVGPVRGLRNYWCACGVMAGFSQGGGVGLALSNWMVNGDPGFDVWGMDVARFGDWTTMAYTNAKVKENYGRRFSIAFPNEELEAARPLKTSPLYDVMKERGAVFGAAFGLEYPLWFAPGGEEAKDIFSFRRSNSHDAVAAECAAVRGSVGLIEISSFAKYEVTGEGAETWLSKLLSNKMPREGRMTLSPMLNEAGKLIGDFTVAKLGPERFMIFGSGPAESYHMRWFEKYLPESGVSIAAHGLGLCGLSIAGPKSRDVLQKLTHEDVSNDAFKFMEVREMSIGMVPALVGRVTFTGDLGFEIWCKPEFLRTVFSQFMDAGSEHGIKLVGSRALKSLSLEKNWGSWATEYRPIYGPFGAGLGRFVDLTKNDFIGRKEAAREREEGPEMQLVAFAVDAGDADVIGDEPVWYDDEVIGWVTSGGFAHHAQTSMALGYIPSDIAANGARNFEIEILGERRQAKIQAEPAFDPDGAHMRG
ncbi:MAG: GcvT family protein, partial [Hyphomicrobiales bacterium]